MLSGMVLPADPFFVTLSTLNVSDSGAAVASGTCIHSYALFFFFCCLINSSIFFLLHVLDYICCLAIRISL